MNTPDKCPHCAGPKSTDAPHWFECGTHESGVQTLLCEERAAHAATRAELEKLKLPQSMAANAAETVKGDNHA